MPSKPKPAPSRGEAFRAYVLETFDLERHELEVLTELVRLLDECDALAAVITTDGYTTTGSTGQTRVHPAVAELRLSRGLVARLVAQLGLPDADDEIAMTPLQRRAQAGNNARWGQHRAAAARRRAAGLD